MKRGITALGLVALSLGAAATASADVKVTKKMEMAGAGGAGLQMTEYVKGNRIRTETRVSPEMTMVTLQQCDLGRTIQINDATKRYFVMSAGSGAAAASAPAAGAPKRGGVVTMTTTVTDTGERKQILGLTARHIKTRIVQEPGPNACDQTRTTMETDGWYVDIEGYGDGCATAAAGGFGAGAGSGCQDEVRTKTVGTAKVGYPVSLTVRTGAGVAPTFEVVDITKTPLDAALFEVPAGYTEAKSFAELMTP
jgi:hypothetical protein